MFLGFSKCEISVRSNISKNIQIWKYVKLYRVT